MEKMKKRRTKMILKIISILIFTSLAIFMLLEGTFLPGRYSLEKDNYNPEIHQMTETQFYLIKSGMYAASSHNMQPWKIQIKDDKTFTLHADMNKILPVVDDNNWQLLISQGTFIDNVKNAAKDANIEIKVIYEFTSLEGQFPLIATFKIVEENEVAIDAVSSSTYSSATGSKIDVSAQILEEFKNTDFKYSYIDGVELIEIKDMLREGNRIESINQEAMEELLDVFRFCKWDKNKYRYGLSLKTMPPQIGMFINPILKYTSNWESFGKSSITVFDDRLSKETGYILIKKDNPSGQDYIFAGEMLSRISKVNSGYTVQPAVQLLEDIKGMEQIGQKFQSSYGVDEEVIFIIGVRPIEDGYYQSVRHNVKDLIVSPTN